MRVAARLREACLQTPLDMDSIRVALEEIASKNVRHDIMQRLGIAMLLKRLQRCSDVRVAALAKVGKGSGVVNDTSALPHRKAICDRWLAIGFIDTFF